MFSDNSNNNIRDEWESDDQDDVEPDTDTGHQWPGHQVHVTRHWRLVSQVTSGAPAQDTESLIVQDNDVVEHVDGEEGEDGEQDWHDELPVDGPGVEEELDADSEDDTCVDTEAQVLNWVILSVIWGLVNIDPEEKPAEERHRGVPDTLEEPGQQLLECQQPVAGVPGVVRGKGEEFIRVDVSSHDGEDEDGDCSVEDVVSCQISVLKQRYSWEVGEESKVELNGVAGDILVEEVLNQNCRPVI